MLPLTPRARWRVALALLVTAPVLAGCGKSGPKLYPVSGKVTVGDKPLTTGSVVFQPDTKKGNTSNHVTVGYIQEDGTYTVMTGKKEGAPLGWYKVIVQANEPPDPKDPRAAPKSLVNKKYTRPETSGLSVEVVESPGEGAYDFKLKK
jgi:hypothetical protein